MEGYPSFSVRAHTLVQCIWQVISEGQADSEPIRTQSVSPIELAIAVRSDTLSVSGTVEIQGS